MHPCRRAAAAAALSCGLLGPVLSPRAQASVCSTSEADTLACATPLSDRVYAWETTRSLTDYACFPGQQPQAGGERVYGFQCPADGPVTFELDVLDCDIDLFVVHDTCGLPGDCADSDTTVANSGVSEVTVPCVAGDVYWVVVESYGPWHFPFSCPVLFASAAGGRVSGSPVSAYSDFELTADCPEGCDNGIDDDGDGDIDCEDTDCDCVEDCTVPGDEDGNGLADCADPACAGLAACCDVDGDGVEADTFACGFAGDCDDADPDVYPGADEVCDGDDEDCDGLVDDADPDLAGAPTWYADLDGDGAAGTDLSTVACVSPPGGQSTATDCDDGDATAFPGADEVCDGDDEDCDGLIDDADTLAEPLTAWMDGDGDGFGAPGAAVSLDACTLPEGYASQGGDCDDGVATAFPGAPEVPYDGIDQDCDGVDLVDVDGDGAAGGPSGPDCVDHDPSVGPGQPELPDGIDSDCDGEVDEGTVWADDDGDGFTETGGDCDDADPARSPAAPETCNGLDDDCDGPVDEDTACSDDDGDGFTEDDGDCHDGDPTIHPGATEVPGEGLDRDCDGVLVGGDDDGDGVAAFAGDCDDGDPAIRPGQPELADGVDQDCDGLIDEGTVLYDDDGDGTSESAGDCHDGDPLIHPNRPEVLGNDRDDDCDGLIDEGGPTADDDGDGFTEDGGDCDDADATVFPGAPERDNGVDDDCDGEVDPGDDLDGDGWTRAEGDCDDTDGWVHPEMPEVCDGLDNDCDAVTDPDCAGSGVTSEVPAADDGAGGCDSAGGLPGGLGLGWLALGVVGIRRRPGAPAPAGG